MQLRIILVCKKEITISYLTNLIARLIIKIAITKGEVKMSNLTNEIKEVINFGSKTGTFFANLTLSVNGMHPVNIIGFCNLDDERKALAFKLIDFRSDPKWQQEDLDALCEIAMQRLKIDDEIAFESLKSKLNISKIYT
jgi:hypothetical protein